MTDHGESFAYHRLQEGLQQQDSPAQSSSRASSPSVSPDPSTSTPRDRSATHLVAGGASSESGEGWRAGSESDIGRGSQGSLGYSDYRIRCLEAKLRDPDVTETQKENMRVAIDMYRRNEELPKWDGLVFIQRGEVVGGNDVDRDNDYWFEVGGMPPCPLLETIAL